jgi:hypothetical protein
MRQSWEALLLQASVATAVLVLVPFLLYRIVKWARKRTKGAYALGAVILPFGLGNVADPELRLVRQAQEQRKKEEDDSGDPPADQP